MAKSEILNDIKNNYNIIKEIGSGGMGKVLLANDIKLERSVAIKILSLEDNAENLQEVSQRFYREAKVVAKLSNPNIVSLYDIGRDESSYYMIMEYVEGKTLSAIIKNTSVNIPPDLVTSIAVQICNALESAHENNIIHRDIKPENIIINRKGIVKLTDFGIAQLINDSMKLTESGSILGSFIYSSPEQLQDSSDIDFRSDLYSLGVTLYELLTGAPPFYSDSFAKLFKMIFYEEPKPIRSYNSDIPEKLERIILKSMSKDLSKRYQSAREMKEDLLPLLNKDIFMGYGSKDHSFLNKVKTDNQNIFKSALETTLRTSKNKISKALINDKSLWLDQLMLESKALEIENYKVNLDLEIILQSKLMDKFSGILIFDEKVLVFIHYGIIVGSYKPNNLEISNSLLDEISSKYTNLNIRPFDNEEDIYPLIISNILNKSGLKNSKNNINEIIDDNFTGYIKCKLNINKSSRRIFNILHIENDRNTISNLKNSIDAFTNNCNYIFVKDHIQAMTILKSKKIDLIIFNLQNKKDFFIFYELYKEIPIIVTSGSATATTIVEIMKKDINDFFVKESNNLYIKDITNSIINIIKRLKAEKEDINYYYGFNKGKQILAIIYDENKSDILINQQGLFDTVSTSNIEIESYNLNFKLNDLAVDRIIKSMSLDVSYLNDKNKTLHFLLDSSNINQNFESEIKDNLKIKPEMKNNKYLTKLTNDFDLSLQIKESIYYRFIDWLLNKYIYMIQITNNKKALSYFFRGIPEIKQITFFDDINLDDKTINFPILIWDNSEILFLISIGKSDPEKIDQFIKDVSEVKKKNKLLRGAIYISSESLCKKSIKVFNKYTNPLSDSIWDNLSNYKGLVRLSASESFQLNFIEHHESTNTFNLICPTLF